MEGTIGYLCVLGVVIDVCMAVRNGLLLVYILITVVETGFYAGCLRVNVYVSYGYKVCTIYLNGT